MSGTGKGSAGGGGRTPAEHTEEQPSVVIRDRRKIRKDDATATEPAPTDAASGSPAAAAPETGEDAPVTAEVDEEPVEIIEAEVVESAPEPAATEASGEKASGEEEAGMSAGMDWPGPLGAELAALRDSLDERTRDLQRVTAEYANYRKRVDRDRSLAGEQAVGSVLAALLPVLDDLDRAREHGDLVGPFGSVAEQLQAALSKFGLTPFGEKGDPFDPTRHEAVAHQTSAEVTEPTCVDILRRGYLLGERLLRPALVAVADPE